MGISSSFAVQLLAKIGAPLAAAIEAGPSAGDDPAAADDMAKMLGLAVDISIALHEKLDVEEAVEQADQTRMSLAAIAANLIADFYISHQKLPEEADKNRMVKLLESVLGFSDKFSSSQDQASRLVTIGNEQVLFDSVQSKLVILQSVGKIISAVTEFPFGQSENKLTQDITERLEKDAFNLAKENGTSDKLSELMIFKSLAALYAECHRAETKKIMANSEEGTPSLDPVWSAYETRVAMMGALVSGGDNDAPQATASEAPEPASVPEAEPVAPLETPLVAPDTAPAGAPLASSGPMGFFAKKPTGESSPPEAPVTPPEPVAETAVPQEKAPPETPPIDNPIDMAADETLPSDEGPMLPDSQAEEKPKGEAGNPMSFFKAPPKEGTKKEDGGE
jgi:hypothetical protein